MMSGRFYHSVFVTSLDDLLSVLMQQIHGYILDELIFFSLIVFLVFSLIFLISFELFCAL